MDREHILCDVQCVEQGLRQDIDRAKSVASRKAFLFKLQCPEVIAVFNPC